MIVLKEDIVTEIVNKLNSMTQQEINKRNSDIAIMLGLKPLKRPYLGAYQTTNDTYNSNFYYDRMEGESWYVYPEYDSDWNWLHEAIEFIEKQKIVVYIHSNRCLIQSTGNRENEFKPTTYVEFYGTDKKEAVFIAVSDFAKLKNEGKL